MAASESYPDDLLYHPEHDWARIDGDEAVLGVTWFAQDALGELVHYEPPDVGATVAKDSSYGEVESVKAVSDLISPLSGEVLEVNQKVVDAPETVNEDPYGDGWLIRIRLSNPDEREQLLDVADYKQVLDDAVSYLSLTDADREAMLAAIGVALDRRALPRHPGRRALRARARRAARAHRGRAAAAHGGARRRRTSSTRSASSAPASTTTTCPRSSTRCCSAASC